MHICNLGVSHTIDDACRGKKLGQEGCPKGNMNATKMCPQALLKALPSVETCFQTLERLMLESVTLS